MSPVSLPKSAKFTSPAIQSRLHAQQIANPDIGANFYVIRDMNKMLQDEIAVFQESTKPKEPKINLNKLAAILQSAITESSNQIIATLLSGIVVTAIPDIDFPGAEIVSGISELISSANDIRLAVERLELSAPTSTQSQPAPIMPDLWAESFSPDPQELKALSTKVWKEILKFVPSKGFYTEGITQNLSKIVQTVPQEQMAIVAKYLPKIATLGKYYTGQTKTQKTMGIPSMSQISAKSLKNLNSEQIKMAVGEMQSFYKATLLARTEFELMKKALPEGADTGIVSDMAGRLAMSVTGIEKKLKSVLSPEILSQIGIDSVESIMQGIQQEVEAQAQAAFTSGADLMAEVEEGAKEQLGIHSPSDVFIDIAKMAMQGLVKGFQVSKGLFSSILQILAPIWQKISDKAGSVTVNPSLTKSDLSELNAVAKEVTQTNPVAKNIADGLEKGISGRQSSLMRIGKSIGQLIRKGTNKELKISSPSEVFADIGRFAIQGLSKGVAGALSLIIKIG